MLGPYVDEKKILVRRSIVVDLAWRGAYVDEANNTVATTEAVMRRRSILAACAILGALAFVVVFLARGPKEQPTDSTAVAAEQVQPPETEGRTQEPIEAPNSLNNLQYPPR